MSIPNKMRVELLLISDLKPAKMQPDSRLSNKRIKKMAANLLRNGQLQPIIVRRIGRGKYEIITGHTRCEAARQMGWTHINATVVECNALDARKLVVDEPEVTASWNALQAMEAYIKDPLVWDLLGTRTKGCINHAKRIFGEDGLVWLRDRGRAPTGCETILRLYAALSTIPGASDYSLEAVGKWFMENGAYQDVHHIAKDGYKKKDLERVLRAIRAGVGLRSSKRVKKVVKLAA